MLFTTNGGVLSHSGLPSPWVALQLSRSPCGLRENLFMCICPSSSRSIPPHESSLMLQRCSSNSHHSLSSTNAPSPATKITTLTKALLAYHHQVLWFLYQSSILVASPDKELTRQSGLLDLLERDDSLMADRGFDVLEDLAPCGVRLNLTFLLSSVARLSLTRER